MTRPIFHLLAASLVTLCVTALPVEAADKPQLWFSSGDDLEVGGQVAHPDFMQLFSPNAPWPTGMANVDVMQLRAPWFLRMPESTVQQVNEFLKHHHIALSVPMGFVASDACGKGVEGIMDQRGLYVYPREMKKRGAELSYVVMDEPLYFGHDYTGKNACNFSIDQVADSVASNVKMIRSYYPKVQFVLVEPEQSLPGGVEELSRFLDLYELKLHERPVAVRFDIAWGRNGGEWRRKIPPFIEMLSARGIGYSIVYNAGLVNGHAANTDEDWVASAKSNVAEWRDTVHTAPVQEVIQTWTPNPVRIVPENDSTSMTGYLKWFVTHH